MEYRELVKIIVKKTLYTPKEVQYILRIFTNTISQTLIEGRDVYIHKLGKFENAHAAARKARNPRTGETMHIPERRRVKFVPSRGLKRGVRRSIMLFEQEQQSFGLNKRSKHGKVRSSCGPQTNTQRETSRETPEGPPPP